MVSQGRLHEAMRENLSELSTTSRPSVCQPSGLSTVLYCTVLAADRLFTLWSTRHVGCTADKGPHCRTCTRCSIAWRSCAWLQAGQWPASTRRRWLQPRLQIRPRCTSCWCVPGSDLGMSACPVEAGAGQRPASKYMMWSPCSTRRTPLVQRWCVCPRQGPSASQTCPCASQRCIQPLLT